MMRPFDEYESYILEALCAEGIKIQRLQDKLYAL